jgi:hypothetical protein
MVERDQVALFLTLLRQCAACDFRFENRDKNIATLARLEMTPQEVRQRILALTPADYVEGPTPRPGRFPQESWVFGLRIKDTDVYVKLSLDLDPDRCLCVSFHESERPMRFPYGNASGRDARG